MRANCTGLAYAATMDSEDRYAEHVRPPGPGEVVGWIERTPDGVIVQWGPPIELELAAVTEGGDNAGP